MKVVEIGGEAESLNGAFYVLFDMSSRVRDTRLSVEAFETAFGSNW
jgi:hypothetical protein